MPRLTIPKVTKANHKILREAKKGQFIKFGNSLNQEEILDIANDYGFGIWFCEPDTMEFHKFGKNTCRLT